MNKIIVIIYLDILISIMYNKLIIFLTLLLKYSVYSNMDACFVIY